MAGPCPRGRGVAVGDGVDSGETGVGAGSGVRLAAGVGVRTSEALIQPANPVSKNRQIGSNLSVIALSPS